MSDPVRIATVSLNPAIDQTAVIPNFTAGAVNRVEREQSDAGGKGVNVASFLAHFGLPVAVTGLLGEANAEPFARLFAEKAIEDRFVRGARVYPGGIISGFLAGYTAIWMREKKYVSGANGAY
jgi:1-phosphofructokinase